MLLQKSFLYEANLKRGYMIKKLFPLLLKQTHLLFFDIFEVSINTPPYIKLIFYMVLYCIVVKNIIVML